MTQKPTRTFPGTPPRILLVDDDPGVHEHFGRVARSTYEVLHATSGEEALGLLAARDVRLVLLDIRMPGMDGIELLRRMREDSDTTDVIVLTVVRDVQIALEVGQLGAADYLVKPSDLREILPALETVLAKQALARENLALRAELAQVHEASVLIGDSPGMREVRGLIDRVAETPATVLVLGESGTGKELVARSIHRRSPRQDRPFVAVNCAALPAELVETELFGHVKGAFTGAGQTRLGKFELADGGTLFLDEIGALRLDLQPKLLRALQEREIQRVGGTKTIPVDVRVVAATNCDLAASVTAGSFREDLYYRLSVVPVRLPPLRHRPEDIPALVDHFLVKHRPQFNPHVRGISPAALRALHEYRWSGNVRELEHAIQRALVLAQGEIIAAKDLPEGIALLVEEAAAEALIDTHAPSLDEAVRRFETAFIRRVLEQVQGNQDHGGPPPGNPPQYARSQTQRPGPATRRILRPTPYCAPFLVHAPFFCPIPGATRPTRCREREPWPRQGTIAAPTAPKLGHTVRFEYDANGNLTKVKDPRNNAITYTYTSMDRVSARTDQLTQPETFSYDLAGNLTSTTDRKNQTTTFTYDDLNRRSVTTYHGGGTVTAGYDAGSRLTSLADSVNGTITWAYDALDRVTTETTPQGTVTYAYDNADRRSTMTVAGQTPVTYAYDNANRLLTISKDTLIATYAYDNANRRMSLTLPNGVTTDYGYDIASRLTGQTYRNGGNTLGTLTYAYDVGSNRIATGGSWARTLLPDPITTASYDAANRQLTLGGKTMAFDNNGNLVTLTEGGQTTTYTWNTRDQLTGISGPVTATFVYDAYGRRTSKTITGFATTFQYDGWDIVRAIEGGTGVNYLRGLAIDETLARLEPESTTSYLADILGSTLALTDGVGIVGTTYTYEPFGRTTSGGPTSPNPFQFTGRENDTTGLYFYRARYHNPVQARFLREDPIELLGGGLNLYAYVLNNPINRTDPLGLVPPNLTSIDAALRNCFILHVTLKDRLDCIKLIQAAAGASQQACAKASEFALKLVKTADQLIPGSVKRSPSYHSPYGSKTYEQILELAKGGDKLAKKMKKLIEQADRFLQ